MRTKGRRVRLYSDSQLPVHPDGIEKTNKDMDENKDGKAGGYFWYDLLIFVIKAAFWIIGILTVLGFLIKCSDFIGGGGSRY